MVTGREQRVHRQEDPLQRHEDVDVIGAQRPVAGGHFRPQQWEPTVFGTSVRLYSSRRSSSARDQFLHRPRIRRRRWYRRIRSRRGVPARRAGHQSTQAWSMSGMIGGPVFQARSDSIFTSNSPSHRYGGPPSISRRPARPRAAVARFTGRRRPGARSRVTSSISCRHRPDAR